MFDSAGFGEMEGESSEAGARLLLMARRRDDRLGGVGVVVDSCGADGEVLVDVSLDNKLPPVLLVKRPMGDVSGCFCVCDVVCWSSNKKTWQKKVTAETRKE